MYIDIEFLRFSDARNLIFSSDAVRLSISDASDENRPLSFIRTTILLTELSLILFANLIRADTAVSPQIISYDTLFSSRLRLPVSSSAERHTASASVIP